MSDKQQDVPFRFQISDRTLFSIRRRLVVQAFGIDDAALAEQLLTAPPRDFESNSEGLLVRSLPLRNARAGIYDLSARPGDPPLICYVLQCFPRYYINMAQSFDDYKQKFSAKTRSTLTRKLKKFAEYSGGQIRWQVFQHENEVESFMRLARQVSMKTYQERLLDAGLPNDDGFKEEAGRLASCNQLRAYILFHGDKPISYLYCPVTEGVVGYAYLGYDPEYRRLSVGTVLQWLALESLFEEHRFRFFDFSEGESEHKRLFATGYLECANVAFLRRTLANRLLVRCHYRFGRATEAVGRYLQERGLKSRVKHWLRFGRAAL